MAMDAAAFVDKWRKVALTERASAQEHFLDLCELVDHPKPAQADPTGSWFAFERAVDKAGGRRGFADVWKKDHFAWEYKKKHRDLDAAFDQLRQYAGNLGNPPLHVACDTGRIVVETHFNGYPTERHEIALEKLPLPRNLDILRKVFHHPPALCPAKTVEAATQEAVKRFAEVVPGFRRRFPGKNTEIAHFLDRIVFCLFAEDVGLLPGRLFSRIVEKPERDPRRVTKDIADLFAAMARGGDVYGEEIPWFNGNLFDDSGPLELAGPEVAVFKEVATLDWSQMDVSIFGTLFERVMDPDQRARLGAHYTSFADITTLVEPVVMAPLRAQWEETRERVQSLLPDVVLTPEGGEIPTPAEARPKAVPEARAAIDAFLKRLRSVRVLDPACGSGNFLYVTLKLLKDLENDVLDECRFRGLGGYALEVGPHQLHGIEINPYAHDLAQMTVWIGHLQWLRDHGYPITQKPILQPLNTIENRDAILDLSTPDFPAEPRWPEVDFIVGNPPFLGGKKKRSELGDDYTDSLLRVWSERLPSQCDLCCYWFEKARDQISRSHATRVGLLATQAIRGGENRQVLARIADTGAIFFAEDDRDWVLNGANVHVSMIGFDDGREPNRMLNGRAVRAINRDLTSEVDVTRAMSIDANKHRAFQGPVKVGSFDIKESLARRMLDAPNPHGRPNSDVMTLWINGKDITSRSKRDWIINFGTLTEQAAALYESPFDYVVREIKPIRATNADRQRREFWWRLGRSGHEWLSASSGLERTIQTPRVSKHRVFVWSTFLTLPDSAVVGIARDDDYFFGVLHSRPHEVWARAQGTQVRERESGFRYTPTTCFETFPFPEPTPKQAEAIAAAAKKLDELRSNWLNPPEWTRTEVLEFPGSVDGPWRRFVRKPDKRGIGTVRYPRTVARDSHVEDLAKRTLTRLYNERPTWLDQAHRALDEAVFAAYAWPADLSDDALLARLLELNLQRAGTDAPAAGEADDADDSDD